MAYRPTLQPRQMLRMGLCDVIVSDVAAVADEKAVLAVAFLKEVGYGASL